MSDFEDIVSGLEIDADIDDVVDYTQLDQLTLLSLQSKLSTELADLQEVRFPRTEEGHRLHSELTAVTNALKRFQ